jgi:RNA polymerase sigma-32 factor
VAAQRKTAPPADPNPPSASDATTEADEAEAGEGDGEEIDNPAVVVEGLADGADAMALDPSDEDDAFAEEGATEQPARAIVLTRGRGSIEGSDPVSIYMREISRYPLLSPDETTKLAERFVETQDPALAAQLVTANLRLVVKIAYEYRRAYQNVMDLVQEGNIGLMQAVKKYDPYRGVRLSSYAAWWIRAYILRFILNNWRLVKLGTTQAQRKLFFNLNKKRAELAALGIDPSDAEVAKRLQVTEAEVAEMSARLSSSERSLDAPVGDADGRSIARVDLMPAVIEAADQALGDREVASILHERLQEFRKTLEGRDKDIAIFDERLTADEPLTLQELGDRFGISRERVRQLEQRLTGKLREYLRDELGEVSQVM